MVLFFIQATKFIRRAQYLGCAVQHCGRLPEKKCKKKMKQGRARSGSGGALTSLCAPPLGQQMGWRSRRTGFVCAPSAMAWRIRTSHLFRSKNDHCPVSILITNDQLGDS